MIHPYPKNIHLLARVESPDGPAMMLSLDRQWVVCYPELIDDSDSDDIDNLHATYLVPNDGKLQPREKMKYGVPLFGYDILHFWRHKGEQLSLTPAQMLRAIFGETYPDSANSAQIIQLADYQTKH